jgi:hypothetical protein
MSNSSDTSKNMRDPLNANPYDQNYDYGVRGDASAAVRGSLVALNNFGRFLALNGLVFLDMSEDDHCDKKLLGEFADYLAMTCTSLTSSNPLKMGTSTQYLSGVISELRIRYPNNKIWEGIKDLKVTPLWYHNIILRLEKDIKKRFADMGIPVIKKILGVGIELLKGMGNSIYVNMYIHTCIYAL